VTGAWTVAAIDIGRTGTWVGPFLVAVLAGALDYSAAGPASIRDRIAVMGYYAAAISFAALTGWTPLLRDMITDYNWRMVGALVSLATHGALLIAFAGRPRALAGQLASVVELGGKTSDHARLNQTLIGWTVAAALSAPLAGTGGWGRVVDGVATVTTGAWSALASAVLAAIGG
jgi:hypothetical protein